MPPKSKPFSDLGHERQRILTKTVSDILERHCPSLDEAHLLLNKAFSRCQSVLPGLSGICGKRGQLVASLGDLRASVAEAFRLSRISEFTTPVDTEVWCRGYYDKPRAWESVGPQAGDVTELTRKFASQKARHTRVPACLCPNDPWKRNSPVMLVLSARVLSKNVVSFVLCELLLVVLLHHFLPLLPRLHRPLLDFANHYFDSCM